MRPAHCAVLFVIVAAGCGVPPVLTSAVDAGEPVDPSLGEVEVPPGYRIEAVARGLSFPTGVTFDEQGAVYVVEAGQALSWGRVLGTPRIVRVDNGGAVTEVVRGDNPPWNGITYSEGHFFISEGGWNEGGRIVQLSMSGERTELVTGLPSRGDYQTTGPVLGPDGYLYFGQGTATNSGVVGQDSADRSWLAQQPEFHDAPCHDVTLTGINFETRDITKNLDRSVYTGAFLTIGTPSVPGDVITGRLPCNGAVMRVRPSTGSEAPPALELVAWGFRSPFGFSFDRDGALFVTDAQYDSRGSRPVVGAGDVLWRVEQNRWYGWPDYSGGVPLSDAKFRAPGGPVLQPLLDAPSVPPMASATLAAQAHSSGFDFSVSTRFGFVGQAFVAQFGDVTPLAPDASATGFKVVRVDLTSGVVTDFAKNHGAKNGPSSILGGHGLERPTSARFSPDGAALYVTDYGELRNTPFGVMHQLQTGTLWRITKE